MPRISKIRIVGNKYDNFRKCHENTVFDLTRNGEPNHTLFTFENGNGKGVLMQLISQIVLPNTRWGKNDGNKITGMFLNRKNQFSPYTFHVIIEWKLDTVPDKWLITGICMTAVKKTSDKGDESEEEKIGVKYFMYTHEHYNDGFYTVENIPAYLKSQKRPSTYAEFEKFLSENKKDFRKFSESQSHTTNSEYYEYLSSNGIYRSEWSVLKLINRVEGGVGEYFSKAKDNKGIFDEYIIPAISENINNQFEENKNVLKDMFKSNISITKNLPILINREDDYKRLSSMLSPLIKDAEDGIEYEAIKDHCISDGNNLFCTLNNIKNNILLETEKWRNEKINAEKQRDELMFQKDNIEYARQIRKKKEYEIKKAEQQEELNTLNAEKFNLKEKKKKYEINKIIIFMEQYEKERQFKADEIKSLMDSLDSEGINEKKEEVENKIKDRWHSTNEKWNELYKQHASYLSYLNFSYDDLKNDMKNLTDKHRQILGRLEAIKYEKERFDKKEKELDIKYGAFQISCPDIFLESKINEKNSQNKEFENLNNECEKIEKEISKLEKNENKLMLDMEQKQKDKNKMRDEYNEKKHDEESLRLKIIEICRLNFDETYSKEWLQDKSIGIAKLKDEKKLKLDELNKELWSNNIDLALNNDDYWIANNDIDVVKSKIEDSGVRVSYGTQLLSILSQNERERYLKDYPMLPFSLVIADEDAWQIIEDNMPKDIFLRNMVPIFIRAEMGGARPMWCRFIGHKGEEFARNADAFKRWKESLSKKSMEISETIKALDLSIEQMDDIINQMNIMLKGESSSELEQKINKIDDDIGKCGSDLSLVRVKINTANDKSDADKKKAKDISRAVIKLDYEMKEIQDFIEFKNEIHDRCDEEKSESENLSLIESKIKNNADSRENIMKKVHNEEIRYDKWKNYIDGSIEDIKRVIKDAELIKGNEKSISNKEPDYESSKQDEIFVLLNKMDILNKNFEDKNGRISALKEIAGQFQKLMNENMNELEKISPKWKNYKLSGISTNTADMEIDDAGKKIKEKDTETQQAMKDIGETSGMLKAAMLRIEEESKKILKEHKKAPEKWEDIDIDKKIFSIRNGIKDNDNYMNEADKILCSLDKRNQLIDECISPLKYNKELDALKGKTSEYIIGKVSGSEKNEVDTWQKNYNSAEENIRRHTEKSQKNFDDFIESLKSNIKDDILKSKIEEMIGDKIKIDNFAKNIDSFKSIKEHADMEINRISSDKLEAEQAKKQWVSRASKQAIKVCECLKEMVNKMVYVNENGYAFKLVRLNGGELLPKEERDVNFLLSEYFIECIEKLSKSGADFDKLDDKVLEKMMSDKMIFSKALRGKYPILEVYKMTEKNEFLYAKPANYNYASWGAINGGEGDSPEGSGGQSLSINTFVIMMLMNYKKRTVGNKNPWTVLMLDNPFGKASGAHVLDPVFMIADKLNFQIIAFAAPEIIKTEISERFPVFWALKINDEKEHGKLGTVMGRVVHGGRIR